ncbi:uncharacterized protein LOC141630984 [Silene latifolia]|uniref:uncharacterized protein LOC141630984 n=1 Tax=Silene latifolia TaxID=37657 RepID=UPI003D770D51
MESGFDCLGAMVAEPVLLCEIPDNLVDDATFKSFQAKLLEGKAKDCEIDPSGYILRQGRIYVLDSVDLRKRVLDEAHLSPYSIHPRGDKMYKDFKLQFRWPNMKNDIVTYVGKCLTCQQVKIEKKRPGGLLQPLDVPLWKWESISMYFVMALLKTVGGKDAVWGEDMCELASYPKETRGYYFYNHHESKVFVPRDAVFLEKEFIFG